MKTIANYLPTSLLFYFLCLSHLSSQNLIYSSDFNNGFANWSTTDEPSMNTALWVLNDSGEADAGSFWGNRERIATTGAAAVFDGDGYSSAGAGPFASILRSPPINLSSEEKVFLKFNQYFRNFDAEASVEVSVDGGQVWTEVFNNDNVGANIETSNRDVQIVDLTAIAAGEFKVLIRFIFKGNNYFWIIDDVELYDDYPYPKTDPEYFSDSLFNFNYPFDIDSSNWAYVPNEIVIQFSPTATPDDKQKLRDTLGAIRIDSCVCNVLELWRLGDNVYADGEQLSADGGTIGILERVNSASSKTTVDGVDLNRYNYNQLQDLVPSTLNPLTAIPSTIPNSPTDAIKIAILDTGVDYEHPDLTDYIWKSQDTSFNNQDDDDSCYDDDPIGWNFIHDNNNPYDDHSHGTHVAGIVVENISSYIAANPGLACDFRIMPYKTHDEHGISNLFDATCATYLAMREGADIINDSWGFYGDPSIILINAFDSAQMNYNTLIIAAAGNDSINVSGLPQYPACFSSSNVISVGSHDPMTDTLPGIFHPISHFSNFDNTCVDILAPGNNIVSTIPTALGLGPMQAKSGTSMSTPAVAAAAAISFCSGVTNHQQVKDKILDCAETESGLIAAVLDGNILNFAPCILPVKESISLSKNEFKIYPNPTTDLLNIQAFKNYEQIQLSIKDISGKEVFFQNINQLYKNENIALALQALPQGLYIIVLRKDHFFWSDKFIKM